MINVNVMKMNRLIVGLMFFLFPICVMGQAETRHGTSLLTDLEGDYQPIGKAKIYGKLSVLRARADTVRIIICDSSLFRNNDDKGEFCFINMATAF